MKIGELLIAEGLVTSAQVEEALQGQVVHGGRLGTNLIERGYASIDHIAEALAKQHNMDAALKQHFDASDPELQSKLPATLAAEWRAVPLTLLSGIQPVVAVTDPLPPEGIESLSQHLGPGLVAAVAPELRVLYYLEKVYGIPRLNRFVRLRPEGETSDDADQRRYIRTLSETMPTEPNALARVAVRKIAVPVADASPQPVEIDCFEAGLRAMRRSQDRARLETALVDTMQAGLVPPFDGLLALVWRPGVATGWTGAVASERAAVIMSLAIPLSDDPVISEALETRQLVRGEPPAGPTHQHMWSALEVPTPKYVVVAPVLLDDEVVGALYAFKDWLVKAETEALLETLAKALGTDFARLLRASER